MLNNYKSKNNIFGWLAFAIAAVVYLMTMEPTTSLWDCGEFIASANKLEVGHPPGAPFFMILARFFALFAGGNKENIAMMVNALSALSSALTILFLFWTISHMAKKLIVKAGEAISKHQEVLIFGSAFIGAMVYTFSDTFWFSAVEGEVYALSSLFTAAVFWAILKWENAANEPHANRWLVLIAYLMGLSIGVHLLNLLALPAIALVYYFKKFKVTPQGTIIAFGISMVALACIMWGIIPGIISMASYFEILFVNKAGMSFHSGVIIFAILLLGILIAGILTSQKKNANPILIAGLFSAACLLIGVSLLASKVILIIMLSGGIFAVTYLFAKNYMAAINTIFLFFTVIIIGYSSFSMIVIRSLANPPMDENNPEHVFSLLSYLNREQYGDRPLMYGPAYTVPPIDQENGKPNYIMNKESGKYEISYYKPEYVYGANSQQLFPRMYSRDGRHSNFYKTYSKGRKIFLEDENGKVLRGQDGNKIPIMLPTVTENIHFFLSYQVWHMYFRYFLWNYSGRQNDMQAHGNNALYGNYITGVNTIDEARLGPQKNMPDSLKNRGNNKFYMLPLILGIIGMVFQFIRNPKDFTVVAMLFFFTGVAIVIYLNQSPYQPRERDYAYAGSFYAFAIWIGLGVLSIYKLAKESSFSDLLKKTGIALGVSLVLFGIGAATSKGSAMGLTFAYISLVTGGILLLIKALDGALKNKFALATITVLITVPAPVIMAFENWDDHDRSSRYLARDIAHNYLQSCDKNAILFTNGDNDTFPLWYIQEVEEVRTDVRVCNLMLSHASWYIEQMRRKAYESEAFPMSIPQRDYEEGGNTDMVYMLNWKNGAAFPISSLHKYISDSEYRNNVLSNSANRNAFMNYCNQNNKDYQRYLGVNHLPSNTIVIPVDTNAVLNNGLVSPKYKDQIQKNVVFTLPNDGLRKNQVMQFDIMANFNWERPLYWVSFMSDGLFNINQRTQVYNYNGLANYLQDEGLASKLTPIRTPISPSRIGLYDTESMYNKIMNVYRWTDMDSPDVYLDEFYRHTLNVIGFREMHQKLASELIKEGKKDSAVLVLDRCMKLLPKEKMAYGRIIPSIIETYYQAGAKDKADAMIKDFADVIEQETIYYSKFDKHFKQDIAEVESRNQGYFSNIMSIAGQYSPDLAKELSENLTGTEAVPPIMPQQSH